jgi:hypothetical protein
MDASPREENKLAAAERAASVTVNSPENRIAGRDYIEVHVHLGSPEEVEPVLSEVLRGVRVESERGM